MIYAERYHDFSAGHRVVGHEGKCALLHGHNYRVHFKLQARELDIVGRVMDFSIIKSILCQWLEDNWDHKSIIWDHDFDVLNLGGALPPSVELLKKSIVLVPFNPTAENMAGYLLRVIGPKILPEDVRLIEVFIWETRKCGAGATL